ncbi:alpha/beta hydrolase [soil metagenome]
MPDRRDATFESSGDTCAAWHYAGEGDAFAGEAGRPCVVMAHGDGGTRDAGLEPFAEAFADAGLDVVLFDYRCFGDSTGEPRQYGWPPRHRDDYRAAVRFARDLEGVDPDRVVLWGTSWSGGHVVCVAADDPRIAAVIAQTPDLDGLRVGLEIAKNNTVAYALRLSAAAIRDGIAGLRGRDPELVPLAAPPGEIAAMNSAEALPGYEAIAGPTWRNEITARALLFEPLNRAVARMDDLRCPVLIQVAERDTVVPPEGGHAAAWKAKGRAEVREYPCNHFGIYVGEWRERSIADQLHFLRRHVGAPEPARASLEGQPG